MIAGENIKGVFFVGIGGIGMSALARYFKSLGYNISGYDRVESDITRSLVEDDCFVTCTDNVTAIPPMYRDPAVKQMIQVIYTPAVPAENKILSWFNSNGYMVNKRSEILGRISEKTDTLAIAGTHGKTTVSTMLAHLLRQSHVGCSAFLGGISKNYNTNFLEGHNSRYTVMEADEFDRSFLRLTPCMAAVTSVDPDHLDIYGDLKTMILAYNEFCSRIKRPGSLVISSRIKDKLTLPEGISVFTYGLDENADYRAVNISHEEGTNIFDLKAPDRIIEGLKVTMPGIVNIENAVAAMAIALRCGVSDQELKESIPHFKGVQRRFDIRINRPGLVFIDDYAHHPEEIKACIESVREHFKNRKITAIFQPHLYSRTKDQAEGFARILDKLDEVILLPIYPAREKPVPGITSSIIYEKMRIKNKRLLSKEEIPGKLNPEDLDVLLTIGAGDIDSLIAPIEELLNKATKE
jgi:UDP-N-acetylmuramate--alanine ligase